MKFFREWGQFMMMGARSLAKWELENSNTILRDHKRLIILALLILPIIETFEKRPLLPNLCVRLKF